MMISTKKRIYHLIAGFLVCWLMIGCASYPNEPRNPKVGDDTYSIEEDGLLSIPKEQGLLSNDSPEEGKTAVVVTSDEKQSTEKDGVIVIEPDGAFTYEPASNFYGKDQITYLIENAKGKQSEGTVFFEVTSVNDPPQPQDDILETPIIEAVTIPVLDNDTDPEGDDIHLVSVDPPAQANDDGTIVYTPPANHLGDVRIRYTVADTSGEQAEAWISLTVIDLNHSIEINPDAISLVEDGSSTLSTSDLLANDRDLLNGTLIVTELSQAQNGITTLENPTFTYTPNADFFGSDTFTYTVQSEAGATASPTVNVTVTPVNDPPTISRIPNQTVTAGNTANIQFSIEDLDNPFSELTVEAEVTNSRPPNLLPDNSINLSGTGGQRALRIATVLGRNGDADITVTVDDGEESSFQSFLLTVTPLAGDTRLYRYWNRITRDHLYTTNFAELGEGGLVWLYERNIIYYVFSSQVPGTVPLYRFWNPTDSDHFYTTGEAERRALDLNPNWRSEGIACYVFPTQRPGMVRLHRYYNEVIRDHFYTTDPAEVPRNVFGEYREEPMSCWINTGPPNR
jgi:hypothetical protein